MDATQDRREFKFLLPSELVGAVRAQVSEHLEADRDAAGGYRIRSDYFDSEDRESYWQKILGQSNRRRVRTRTYGEPGTGRAPTRFVEIKHKQGNLTVKRRLLVDGEEMAALLGGRVPPFRSAEDERFPSELCDLILDPPWRPGVRIQYHRWAYDSGADGTIRITFDTRVRCCFPDYRAGEDPEPDLDLLGPGGAIMEVKTIGPVPYWFRCLLGHFALVPRGFSKYTVALGRFEFGRSDFHEPRHPVQRHPLLPR